MCIQVALSPEPIVLADVGGTEILSISYQQEHHQNADLYNHLHGYCL